MMIRSCMPALWIAYAILGVHPYLYAADIGPPAQPAIFRLERTDVSSKAELVTLFSTQFADKPESAKAPNPDIPILSVLRDTLNDSDPANDRLRQVYIYGYAQPSIWQRFIACLPFVYRQASPQKYKGDGPPRAVLDLAAPGKNTVYSLLGAAVQVGVLDNLGVPVRLASRNYRGSSKDYRDLKVHQALLALSDFAKSSTRGEFLTPEEVEVLGARLLLSTRLLGGIVSERYLQSAWDREILKSNQNCGRNWELLRQKAEENGLYFDPLSFGGQENKFALLWIDQSLVSGHPSRSFDKKFLGISNPFADKRLMEWSGYTQTWHFDDAGIRVADESTSSRSARMIPLALYALDHPRTPLLLVDIRQAWKPGTKERARRISTDLMADLLRLTSISNWQFTIAKSALFFVKSRHGAALNRSARLRAYAQLQHSLKLDTSTDPDLHQELARYSQRLGLNPFDREPETQVDMAKQQHSALLAFASSPEGLAARIDKDRAGELNAEKHPASSRALFKIAGVATFGLYQHREKVDAAGYLRLDQHRQFTYHKRLLERFVQPGIQPDTAWRLDEVRQSLDAMFELGEKNTKLLPAAKGFVSELFKKTDNELVSRQCAAGLLRFQGVAQTGKSPVARTARVEHVFLTSTATAFR